MADDLCAKLVKTDVLDSLFQLLEGQSLDRQQLSVNAIITLAKFGGIL